MFIEEATTPVALLRELWGLREICLTFSQPNQVVGVAIISHPKAGPLRPPLDLILTTIRIYALSPSTLSKPAVVPVPISLPQGLTTKFRPTLHFLHLDEDSFSSSSS